MMTAAQMEMIANDYAERAFFVSGVEPGVILSDFEDKAGKVATGALSYEEAQQAIRETLRQQGYRPPETGQGGIQDLSSWLRIQVVMETNAAMAHGYRNWYNWTQDDSTAAFKFYRSQGREDPRYWAERWNRARSGLEKKPRRQSPPALSAAKPSAMLWRPLRYGFASRASERLILPSITFPA